VSVVESLRELFDSSEEWTELCDLQVAFDQPGADRLALGGRIADLLESYADRMDRSRLVRVVASGFTPGRLRAEAPLWREGRDPHA
jgi:hypothetical protein